MRPRAAEDDEHPIDWRRRKHFRVRFAVRIRVRQPAGRRNIASESTGRVRSSGAAGIVAAAPSGHAKRPNEAPRFVGQISIMSLLAAPTFARVYYFS